MTTADQKRAVALALLKRYLEQGCEADEDSVIVMAHSYGSALAMLSHLLGLYGDAHPETARAMFERWRAEHPPHYLPFLTVEEANAAGFKSGTLWNGDTFGDEDDETAADYRPEALS